MSMRNIVDGRCARCYQPATSKCSKCKQRAYCNANCQRKDWQLGHKFNCGRDADHDAVESRPEAPNAAIFDPQRLSQLLLAKHEQSQFEGLVNIQNTCYINSVLQCVVAVPGLYEALVESLTPENTAASSAIALPAFLACMAALSGRTLPAGDFPSAPPLSALRQDSASMAVVPLNLVTCLVQLSAEMSFGSQEDAHELYQVLVRSLSKAIVVGKILRPLNKETTAVDQLFTSVVASQLLCPKCSYRAVSFERQIDLQLEIEGYTDSLEEMLEAFTCPERLDADNKYKCHQCSQLVRAHKQLSIFHAPNVLAIQLKRFRVGVHGRVGKFVSYPSNLNLKNLLHNRCLQQNYMTPGSPDAGSVEYELFGILIHLTVQNLTTFGHYVSVVKGVDGQWRVFDDQQVQLIDSDAIDKTTPYMTGLCLGNCGFYGAPDKRGYCSKCFKDNNVSPMSAEELAQLQSVSETETASADAEVAKAAAALEQASLSEDVKPAVPSTQPAPTLSKPSAKLAASTSTADKVKAAVASGKIGRNDPCPCGSSRKYKKCHGN